MEPSPVASQRESNRGRSPSVRGSLRPPSLGDDARLVAWLALREVERDDRADAQETLGELARRAGLDARDRALAFDLTQGVLRWRRLLDAAIASLDGFESARIPSPTRDVLRLGAYQHFWLGKIPRHAVVHATIEVARKRLGARAAGFCNAALQQLLRQRPDRGSAFDLPAAGLPLDARHSMPRWLVRLLKRELGAENLEPALARLNQPLPLFVRCNPAIASPEEAVRILGESEIRARSRSDLAPRCVEIEGAASLLVDASLFKKGGLTIQDPSAQLVAEFASAEPGMTVADLCAAPGGKTAALAEAMGGVGRLIACDVSEERLARLRENLARLGHQDFVEVRIIEPEMAPAGTSTAEIRPPLAPEGGLCAQLEIGPGSADLIACDRVLVDAPCSGLGTLRRHPEIRWRVRPSDLARMARIQGRILDRAVVLVRPGGWLVYATCSFASQENAEVVSAFLERHPGSFQTLRAEQGLPVCLSKRMGRDGWMRTLPHRDDMDSGGAVRLLRIA